MHICLGVFAGCHERKVALTFLHGNLTKATRKQDERKPICPADRFILVGVFLDDVLGVLCQSFDEARVW